MWGPLIGPVVSMLSFVCSIGNVPLAGVLWNAGISFGGVISFIFADLIILPILFIYKKYYGTRMMLFILASFYATMVAAGYVVELLFTVLGLVPTERDAKVGEVPISGTTPRCSTSWPWWWPRCSATGSSGPAGCPCSR